MMVKNLSQLKRALHKGAVFRTVWHRKWPEIVGLPRVVTSVQGNALYTKIKGQPEHRISRINDGMGLRMDFYKATNYRFGDTVKVYTDPNDEKSLLLNLNFWTEIGRTFLNRLSSIGGDRSILSSPFC